ncbi:MAG: HAMP domain-containing protein [Desulfobacteraceae bacterium]|nr:HAMP domain-containing protein [Desulfobacteraceae bacterium]
MKIKYKAGLIILIPIIAIVILIALGWITMNQLTENTDDIVNDQLIALIEDDISPFISEEILPLINEDIAKVELLEEGIRLILIADRHVHQAVIAEKMALVSDKEEMPAVVKASKDNIRFAETLMKDASEDFNEEGLKLYAEFVKAFTAWKERTKEVIELANTPGNMENARVISDRGEAYKIFSTLTGIIYDLQIIQENHVKSELDKLKKKKDNINSKEKKIKEKRQRAEEAIESMKQESSSIIKKFIIIGIVSAVTAFFIAMMFARNLVKTIHAAVYLANIMAKGDMTYRLNTDQKDEIGDLCRALNSSAENLSEMFSRIQQNALMLGNSAEQLSTVSALLAKGSENMTGRADNVAGATEEMSLGINTMASAAEEMSMNVQSVSSTTDQMSQNMNAVASAVEQMSAAIRDIAENSREGTRISTDAIGMSDTATITMNILGDAAREIGKVTSVIKRIAEQTNLLALNATIEAASAGDAGKGFAVVANEIKELANQSAQAAEDIAGRIEGVQKNTEEAVKVIEVVSKIITNINQSSVMITNAVEQQTHTSNDISANIQQANTGVKNIASSIAEIAKGANDMSRNAGEAAKGANDVASNIQGVSQSAEDVNNSAQQVNTSAVELASVAGELQEMVGQFKVEREETIEKERPAPKKGRIFWKR